MLQSKDTDWLNEYKNKTLIYNTVYMLSIRDPLQTQRHIHRLKLRRRKKIFHANGNQEKAGVPILISDKIDFKIKNVLQETRENTT